MSNLIITTAIASYERKLLRQVQAVKDTEATIAALKGVPQVEQPKKG